MIELLASSPSFENKGLIPIQYTGYGSDISPEISLSNIHPKGKYIAIIMDDMGHPIPAYNHWVIWNIPVMETLSENISYGKTVGALGDATQGKGYGKHRYKGPPPFNWSHEYHFNVYVLESKLSLPATAKKRWVLEAMQGKILQHGILAGHYK